VPVAGPLAGWRLEQVRRHFEGPAQLVLGVQRGVPFSDFRLLQQMVTALGLSIAIRRFSRATLIVAEDPEVQPACLQALARAAGSVVVPTPAMAQALAEGYGLQPGSVTVEEVDPYPNFAEGVDSGAAGIYRPGADEDITVVTLPPAALPDRVRARARSSTASFTRRLAGR
jgi:hypothetical protein